MIHLGYVCVSVCVSGRGWRDKGLGREDAEYEQSGEVQQGTRHLHCGEGGRLLPVLPGEFVLGVVVYLKGEVSSLKVQVINIFILTMD